MDYKDVVFKNGKTKILRQTIVMMPGRLNIKEFYYCVVIKDENRKKYLPENIKISVNDYTEENEKKILELLFDGDAMFLDNIKDKE